MKNFNHSPLVIFMWQTFHIIFDRVTQCSGEETSKLELLSIQTFTMNLSMRSVSRKFKDEISMF